MIMFILKEGNQIYNIRHFPIDPLGCREPGIIVIKCKRGLSIIFLNERNTLSSVNEVHVLCTLPSFTVHKILTRNQFSVIIWLGINGMCL